MAGDDKGESSESTRKPDKTVGDKSTVKSLTASSAFQEYSLVDECPMARIFAYGATSPAFDADHKTALVFQPMHNYALVSTIIFFVTRFEGILEKYEKSQFKTEMLINCL